MAVILPGVPIVSSNRAQDFGIFGARLSRSVEHLLPARFSGELKSAGHQKLFSGARLYSLRALEIFDRFVWIRCKSSSPAS